MKVYVVVGSGSTAVEVYVNHEEAEKVAKGKTFNLWLGGSNEKYWVVECDLKEKNE